MIPIKLSQLPQFSGDSSGSYIVINDASNSTTYIVNKESFFTASLHGTASFALTASYVVNGAGSGLTKFWLQNATQSVSEGETIVVSDNFVLKNASLVLNGSAEEFLVQNISFTKKAQIFIGGHLLLVDSSIINDGIVSVAGAVILSGSSTITGNGILI